MTDASFQDSAERSPVSVLLDIWAPWCGPCRMIAPIVEDLAAEYTGGLRVAKLNVDDEPVTAARFAIRKHSGSGIQSGKRDGPA